MRGVATSDLHLGHRRYPAQVEGRNAREVDVERAWERVVDHIVGAAPDLVTIAGDCFEHPRVGTAAEIAFRSGIRRIVRGAEAHVVILQGNHDAVKTSAARSPIWIPADYERVHVVDTPKRLHLEAPSTGETVAVAAFPYVSLAEGESYRLEPDPEADVNVLCLHGAVKGGQDGEALPYFYAGDEALDVSREAEDWNVVACGDFHAYTRLHPDRLAFYSGAIERTSSNIWEETEPKGIVVYDTSEGSLDFVEHETRDVVSYDFHDLISYGLDPSPGRVNDALIEISTWQVEGDIIRLVVPDFPRGRRNEVDWETVRELKSVCLHFALDLRWSDRDLASIHDRRTGEKRTLEGDAIDFFDEDEAGVRALAFDYIGISTEGGAEPDNSTQDSAPDPGHQREAVAAGGAT